MILKKIFFNLMKNADFGTITEYVRKHRDIRFVATKKKELFIVSGPNSHTEKFFTEYLLAIEMKNKQ